MKLLPVLLLAALASVSLSACSSREPHAEVPWQRQALERELERARYDFRIAAHDGYEAAAGAAWTRLVVYGERLRTLKAQ